MSSVVDNDRPPYVAYEYRAVENRDASIAAGHFVSKDVAYAIITRPGSRDTLDKEAETFLREYKEKARQGVIPQVWYDSFKASFDAWKTGEELPVDGTPIKGWQVLSPSAQKDLIRIGIRTVEDLAAYPDGDLSNIGTGAVSYKLKATAWLEAAKGPGKVAEQMAAQAIQLQQLIDLTRAQAEEIAKLKAQIPQPVRA